jgi:cytochrome c-type biogenesis protein CcmE
MKSGGFSPLIRFGAVTVIVVGTLVWLAVGGVNESKSYFKTVDEVKGSAAELDGKRLRMNGEVVKGSIQRKGSEVWFTLRHKLENQPASPQAQTINVVYNGTDPLPDTFRDESEALADGRLMANGSFEAKKIQAKCASKYESKPGQYQRPPKSLEAAVETPRKS